jgi:FkbM family methyltransferase
VIDDDERSRRAAERLPEALRYVTDFGLAVDAGAHIGLWSRIMAERFELVVAFEPLAENWDAWEASTSGYTNTSLWGVALGDEACRVRLEGEGASLHYAVKDRTGPITMRTLDSYGLPVTFLKVDCEGADTLVLRGAERTLHQHRPVVMVECIDAMARRYGLPAGAAVAYLESLGMHWVMKIGNDTVFVWDA